MLVTSLPELLRPLLPLWGVCEHEGQRVIAAAFPYLLPEEYYAERNISRYAVVHDYHTVCGARLEQACHVLQSAFPSESFRWYCDSSPLPEKTIAEKAGLGAYGKHNLLITQKFGSWVFLGEIVTSAKLPCNTQLVSPCSGCGACLRACPTGALSKDGFMREKCISFISQRKGTLTPEQAALLRRANTVWGCDICQQACPHNKKPPEPLPEFLENTIAHVTQSTPLEGRPFAWRGESVIRRNVLNLHED